MVLDRSRALQVRELSETLLNRAQFLDPADRALLQQVLGRGVKPREVAAVIGQTTRGIQRRIRRLMLRLADPEVLFIIRQHRKWSPVTGQVATAVWVRQWTLRRTAAELQLSLHQVRQQVQIVRGLIQESEIRGQKSEVRSQKSEVRSRRSVLHSRGLSLTSDI